MEKEKIDQYFAPVESRVDEAGMISKWRQELLAIIDRLQDEVLPLVLSQAKDAIDTWVAHPDHGARHSFHVYSGMVWLAQEDGISVDDSKFQALAVLHDLAQLLPFANPVSGERIPGDQRKLHAETMAQMILLFAKSLDLSESESNDLLRSIRHHDDEYNGKHYTHFSSNGMLLADADKLFGGGVTDDPSELARDAIVRNQKGSGAPDGWYLLRDLSSEERESWQYGDRWWQDRLSAVRKDMFGIQFYTEAAQKLAAERREAFLDQAYEAYGNEYEQTLEAIQLWRDSVEEGRGIEVFLTGKNPNGKEPLRERILNSQDIGKTVLHVFNRRLNVGKKRENEEARGWKIQIETEAGKVSIDPSIARFIFSSEDPEEAKQNFLQAMENVFLAA